MRTDGAGRPLVPGHNVDKVSIPAGLREAQAAGYGTELAQQVVWYALWRHARGEEDGAERTWLSEYPHDLTSWKRILAAATVQGAMEAQEKARILNALKGED